MTSEQVKNQFATAGLARGIASYPKTGMFKKKKHASWPNICGVSNDPGIPRPRAAKEAGRRLHELPGNPLLHLVPGHQIAGNCGLHVHFQTRPFLVSQKQRQAGAIGESTSFFAWGHSLPREGWSPTAGSVVHLFMFGRGNDDCHAMGLQK